MACKVLALDSYKALQSRRSALYSLGAYGDAVKF